MKEKRPQAETIMTCVAPMEVIRQGAYWAAVRKSAVPLAWLYFPIRILASYRVTVTLAARM